MNRPGGSPLTGRRPDPLKLQCLLNTGMVSNVVVMFCVVPPRYVFPVKMSVQLSPGGNHTDVVAMLSDAAR